MTRVLVTGATGFLGRHVLRCAPNRSHHVFGLSRRNNAHVDCEIPLEMIQGDLCRPESLSNLNGQFDAVIHLAGEKRDPALFGIVNVAGTRNLLGALGSFQHFVLVSSVGVTGPTCDEVINEETIARPVPGYETSKYLAEKEVVEFCLKHGAAFTILRPTNVFGEFSPDLPLLNWIRSIKTGRFSYIGKRPVWFNYVYADDVGQACWIVLENRRSVNCLFQVATPVSLPEAVETVADELHVAPPKRRVPVWVGFGVAASLQFIARTFRSRVPFDLARFKELTNTRLYSGLKLQDEVGFKPRVGPRTGLRRMVRWYSAQALL